MISLMYVGFTSLLDRRLQSWWKLLTVDVSRSLVWSAVLLSKSRGCVTPGKQSCSLLIKWLKEAALFHVAFAVEDEHGVRTSNWRTLALPSEGMSCQHLPAIPNAVDLPQWSWCAFVPMLRTHTIRCKDPMDWQQQLKSSNAKHFVPKT